MALTKAQKQKIIEDLKEKIEKQKIVIFLNFKGLKAGDILNLKRKLKKVDAQLTVAKKTLLNLVLKERSLEIDLKKLEGEIALIFGYQDIILPTKTVWQFSEEYPNLKILAGILENKFVGAEKIIELAKLPTREELLARLVRSIFAPISNFVNVLEGNIKGLLYTLSVIKK